MSVSWRADTVRLGIALGAVALFYPGLTLYAFALVFAAFSFVDGIFALIAGVRGASHHTQRWGALVLSGIVGIAVGVIFVLWPLLATAASAGVPNVVVVAHDPGMTVLAESLSGGGIGAMPTCAVATFRWSTDDWDVASAIDPDEWSFDRP